MATAILNARTNFHGFNQLTGLAIDPGDDGGGQDDYNGFWPVVNVSGGEGNAVPVGTTDVGEAMQTAETSMYNNWPDHGSGIEGGSQVVIFRDLGVIPADATIDSIQVVARVSCVHAGLSTGPTSNWMSVSWGPQLSGLPWTGLSDDFTTAGFETIQSDVMTLNPSTGVAWLFAELYGNPIDPFGAGSFNGWWVLNPFAGLTNPGGQVFQLDYVALVVAYNGSTPPTPPPNLESSPPFQTPGQWALHRFDLRPTGQGPAGNKGNV